MSYPWLGFWGQNKVNERLSVLRERLHPLQDPGLPPGSESASERRDEEDEVERETGVYRKLPSMMSKKDEAKILFGLNVLEQFLTGPSMS